MKAGPGRNCPLPNTLTMLQPSLDAYQFDQYVKLLAILALVLTLFRREEPTPVLLTTASVKPDNILVRLSFVA